MHFVNCAVLEVEGGDRINAPDNKQDAAEPFYQHGHDGLPINQFEQWRLSGMSAIGS